jgi:hypothetical protein
LARPAVINSVSSTESQAKGLFIHIRNHQDFIGFGILGDSGNQAVGVKFWGKIQPFFNEFIGGQNSSPEVFFSSLSDSFLQGAFLHGMLNKNKLFSRSKSWLTTKNIW